MCTFTISLIYVYVCIICVFMFKYTRSCLYICIVRRFGLLSYNLLTRYDMIYIHKHTHSYILYTYTYICVSSAQIGICCLIKRHDFSHKILGPHENYKYKCMLRECVVRRRYVCIYMESGM